MVRYINDGMVRLEDMRTCFFIREEWGDTYEIQGNFRDF